MSAISKDQVLHLAQLSYLDLTDAEIVQYQKELSHMIDFINQLQQAEVDQLAPTEQVTQLQNVTRADEISATLNLPLSSLATNADLEENQFKVPKVKL